MKAIILAGGVGTRLSEETQATPKPLVEIGGRPILWHIMKSYSAHGIDDFIICLGYKGYLVKEYFANYFLHQSDVTIDVGKNSMDIHKTSSEPWKVTLADTGEDTMTGGRLRRAAKYLDDSETFCFTYGDGVSDLDIRATIDFHRQHESLATVTSVQPPGRFGALELNENQVTGFQEKPRGDGGWINGGFFVLNRKAIDYIGDDSTSWEAEPMNRLAQDRQLQAFFHNGFWHAMDTLRDKNYLEQLWTSGNAPWRTWK